MRFPKDNEVVEAIRLEKDFILVRRDGGRTRSEMGLALPGGGLETPYSKIIALGPEYKGAFKKGDRVFYSESHVIPHIDVGHDKKGNLAFVNPEKVLGSIPAELFEEKNGETAKPQASV